MTTHIQHLQQLQLAGTLASGIAHDMNNQLTLVLGHLDLALKHLPPGYDAYDSLELARTAAIRCADMSRRLLYLGHPPREVMAPVDLATAIAEAGLLLECVKPPKTRLTVESRPGLLILGDATQIQQVLINLGTNAFHSMPAGGDLEIRAYCEDGKVNIEVRDSGCGIPASLRSKIFQPFFTTHPESGGSGLGLCTVRSIVSSHCGVLDFDSEPGKGTTFHLSFPALSPGPEEPRGEKP